MNTGDADGARLNADRARQLAAEQGDAALAAQIATFLRALGPAT